MAVRTSSRMGGTAAFVLALTAVVVAVLISPGEADVRARTDPRVVAREVTASDLLSFIAAATVPPDEGPEPLARAVPAVGAPDATAALAAAVATAGHASEPVAAAVPRSSSAAASEPPLPTPLPTVAEAAHGTPLPATPVPATSTVAPLADLYLPAPNEGPPTDLEARLLAAANAAREGAGLPPLVHDADLTRIARIRSQQMAERGYFGHHDPDGYHVYVELLARFGHAYAWAGENLALNNYDPAESPERALAALMASAAHRENILFPGFERVGVGHVTDATGRHIYTLIFLG